MKIVIADDHSLFVDGLKNLLESQGYQVIGAAKDGMEAFNLAKKLQPDVMLIDIFMPNCDGLEATMLINANFPQIKIVILTSSENEEDVFKAVKYGACGYFIKTFSSDELLELLAALEQDETVVSPGLAGKVLEEFQTGQQESAEGNYYLTNRQREVLSLVAQGHLYKDIGTKLDISERTVKYHIQSAVDKLHLQNRQQLISYASKAGLLNI
jgi:DNA-binding NarL/FixJ family response regulator